MKKNERSPSEELKKLLHLSELDCIEIERTLKRTEGYYEGTEWEEIERRNLHLLWYAKKVIKRIKRALKKYEK